MKWCGFKERFGFMGDGFFKFDLVYIWYLCLGVVLRFKVRVDIRIVF